MPFHTEIAPRQSPTQITGSVKAPESILQTVAGKGFGTTPENVISNPMASPYFGRAADMAWQNFMAGGALDPYRATAQRTLGYNVAEGQAGQDRERAIREADFALGGKMEGRNFARQLQQMLFRGMQGGTPSGMPDMAALIEQILAPVRRQQQEARDEAQSGFIAGGREVGGNTAWQDILSKLTSRQGEDIGAVSSRATLGMLPSYLQAQSAQQQGQGQMIQQILSALMGGGGGGR